MTSRTRLTRRAALAGAALLAVPTSGAFGEASDQERPASAELSLSEQLLYTTIRIEARDQFSNQSGYGTGFFFSLFFHEGRHVPVLVTNKHVLKRAGGGFLATSCAVRLTAMGDNNSPKSKEHVEFALPGYQDRWIAHPSEDVDLCILPVGDLFEGPQVVGAKPFFKSIRPDFVMTDNELRQLSPVEDTLVIGYPLGLSDTTNNLPILRRGITATSPMHDFNGRGEFLIDAPIFVGSSGSPVFLYSRMWTERVGGPRFGERVKLLGIVWGVESQRLQGDILFVPAPTQHAPQLRPVPQVEIPANLGVCIKASRLFDFEPLMAAMGFKAPDGFKYRANL